MQLIGYFRNLYKCQKAATAIEYGLIAGLIAVVIISALTLMGGELSDTFNSISDGLNSTT